MTIPSPTIYDAMSQTSLSGETYHKEGTFKSQNNENFKQSQHSTRTLPNVTLQTSFKFAKVSSFNNMLHLLFTYFFQLLPRSVNILQTFFLVYHKKAFSKDNFLAILVG